MKKELLIFGSNGALGKGVTKTLLSKNYNHIYLFDFSFDKKRTGKAEKMIIKDLADEKNVKKAFDKIVAGKDKVFYLFSTVGGFAGGTTIRAYDTEEWDKMMSMNLKANFLIAKYFSQLVKNSHSGSICFTAAFTGIEAEPGKSAYGASKGALIHFVKTLAEEGKEICLSANAIAPYIIDTPANRKWMKDADYDSWMKPEEIGEFVNSIFLNYNYLTGNIFRLTNRFNADKTK